MAEEKAAQHLSRRRAHRHGEVTHDREMAFGHAMMRGVAAVAGIAPDIVRADHTRTAEGRFKQSSVPGQAEAREGGPGRTGQGVERVALAAVVDQILEEGAEFGLACGRRAVGDDLEDRFQVVVAGSQLSDTREGFDMSMRH
jgi:hypothetical protein